MRWSARPDGFKPNPGPGPAEGISEEWDALSYDWLGDTYSSQANPVFWKLHGWVDARIDDWARANPEKLVDGKINWTGTWIGEMGGITTF